MLRVAPLVCMGIAAGTRPEVCAEVMSRGKAAPQRRMRVRVVAVIMVDSGAGARAN
jgi:hypothetical protein